MKKLFTLILIFALSLGAYSQTDSTATDSTKTSKFSGTVFIASKSLWRGIDFGNGSPSIQGLVTYSPFKFLDINVFGVTALNGTMKGYSNTMNIFLTFKYKKFYFEVDDYYFKGDITNIPTNYWYHDKTHFVEARIGFKNKIFDLKAGYTIYGGGLYNNPVIDTLGTKLMNTQAFYLEANIKLTSEFSVFIGGITAPSSLNFTDKAGITNVGAKYSRSVVITDKFSLPIDAVLMINPNYENISPAGLPRVGYGTSPVNFAITVMF
jgi:hypothetical protein